MIRRRRETATEGEKGLSHKGHKERQREISDGGAEGERKHKRAKREWNGKGNGQAGNGQTEKGSRKVREVRKGFRKNLADFAHLARGKTVLRSNGWKAGEEEKGSRTVRNGREGKRKRKRWAGGRMDAMGGEKRTK